MIAFPSRLLDLYPDILVQEVEQSGKGLDRMSEVEEEMFKRRKYVERIANFFHFFFQNH